ncbi:glycoside hydrolase family 78 protein [Echinicola sp. CAU 1574]|uniref:alpha-L-rhamnosidase n=1 Tax=Echinicola arenosa TaxID=2774144 RepID=A0ABR9AJT0_9BACT|nr:glycoside hydrolase family 78 protein [Echinicola arenosa]MBD8488571.1 glycoside hydrolase family 78 protein [Echinicola arenosa]
MDIFSFDQKQSLFAPALGLLLLCLLFFGCGPDPMATGPKVVDVTVEMMHQPLGLEIAAPRLSWKLSSQEQGARQSAYQVVVYHSSEGGEETVVWDSGKVDSDQSQMIAYQGVPLIGGQRYFWKVKVWNEAGNASDWSQSTFFEMAPDHLEKQAKWIGAISREDSGLPSGRNFHEPDMRREENKEKWSHVDPLAKQSIQLRKAFKPLKKIKKATIYISGLGHYELTLNGEKVGNSEFAPLWSDYDKTVYYNTYDVTERIKKGENAIGVVLGNGMYNVTGDRYAKFLISFGPPTLFFNLKLEFENGKTQVVASDETWKWTESPITFNCIFGGEDYDANREQEGWNQAGFSDEEWNQVVIQKAPLGSLKPQLAPSVGIQQQFDVKSVSEPAENVYVLDMGQNLAGFPSITVKGKKGQTVKLVVGEHLKESGMVGQGRTGGPHYYSYTLKGEGEESWQPKFSYYGYQYIQVENVNLPGQDQQEDRPSITEIKSNFIYNRAEEKGSFESSNGIFNQTHWLINNAIKSNMQSVFTDCPHREKLGWLEETYLNGPGLFYNYDLGQLVPKVMQDMADAQRDNGLVPSIAPEYVVFGGDFTDSPEWGVACVVLPWMYYEYYGDSSLIAKYYPTMKRYIDYLGTTAEHHIVSHGLGDWYDYGEHAAGYSKNSPIALSATSHYYLGISLVKKAAAMLQQRDDFEKYQTLEKAVKEAFNAEFFNPATNQYGTGSQFSNAVPVFLDIVDPSRKEAVLDNLVKDIKEHGYRLTTGDVGNRYLYQTLARNGLNQLMYQMHNHYEAPGYGFQIKFGLTTLTEQWDPRKGNSWNHFMMGQIEEWFYRDLAGIQPDTKNPGFKHFYLKPHWVGDLEFVKASYESRYGKIVSEWKRENAMGTFHFTIPVNTSATVVLPVENPDEVLINGRKPEKDALVKENQHGSFPVYKLGSGEYEIVVK